MFALWRDTLAASLLSKTPPFFQNMEPDAVQIYKLKYSESLRAGLFVDHTPVGTRRGSHPGRDEMFRNIPRPAFWSTHPPVLSVPRLYSGETAVCPWLWPPTPTSAEVKERVELNLYFLSGPSWPVIGRTYCYVSNTILWVLCIECTIVRC
jgi:hypothetical protein